MLAAITFIIHKIIYIGNFVHHRTPTEKNKRFCWGSGSMLEPLIPSLAQFREGFQQTFYVPQGQDGIHLLYLRRDGLGR